MHKTCWTLFFFITYFLVTKEEKKPIAKDLTTRRGRATVDCLAICWNFWVFFDEINWQTFFSFWKLIVKLEQKLILIKSNYSKSPLADQLFWLISLALPFHRFRFDATSTWIIIENEKNEKERMQKIWIWIMNEAWLKALWVLLPIDSFIFRITTKRTAKTKTRVMMLCSWPIARIYRRRMRPWSEERVHVECTKEAGKREEEKEEEENKK